MKGRKILTIGVPTFNRAHLLEDFFSNLHRDLGSCSNKVVIIISDNASTDHTRAICERWATRSDELEIRYVCNEANIGASKNLVSLFYRADTPYFMFLGDDDQLDSATFPKVIELLESASKPAAVIQAYWGGSSRTDRIGYVPFESAVSLFYEYGNSWAGVVDTAAAIHAIESRNLRGQVEQIVWPQTVFGFLAMHDLSPQRKVYFMHHEMGRPIASERFSIDTGTYFRRSLNDLLVAATLVDQGIGSNIVRKHLLRWSTLGFKGHIQGILRSTLIEGRVKHTNDLLHTLRQNYGMKGLLWALFIQLTSYSAILMVGAMLGALLLKGMSPKAFQAKIDALKKMRFQDIAQAAEKGKRLGDWF